MLLVAHRVGVGMSLRDDLLEIQGVGDATADKIMAAVDDHTDGGGGVDRELVEQAMDYIEEGRAGYGVKYLERALDE